MTGLRNAFKRKAKLKQHEVTLPKMHWRHEDRGWDVVSTVLCDRWDNATHPEKHEDFESKGVGDNNEITRFNPKDPGEWETFHTEESHMPDIIDDKAYNQFLGELRDIEFLNAEAVATFLHDTFTADYYFDSKNFNGTGRHDDCSNCDGTGRILNFDENTTSLTYCPSGCEPASEDNEKPLRVTDAGCSCNTCNDLSQMSECPECDGSGEIYKEKFTRTFPYKRDKILSEYPSQKELQVLQFTLNKMANAAEENDTTPSIRQVVQLFSTLENRDSEALISQAVHCMENAFDTIEVPETDADGNTITDDAGELVMTEQPDPEAVKETKVKLSTTLTSMSEEQAAKQVA